ncbi:MAG: sulfotransferase domain-containing protein [Planctomycetaceae bacterium]|jgi:hypothetical protein
MAALSERPAEIGGAEECCRQSRHGAGRSTLPNLIIPGAQKSGTSSLHAWLADHPQCVMSQPKEPMFFSRSDLRHGIAQYSKCFPHDHHDDIARIIGEASTTYLSIPGVPARIADVIGKEVKFVFVLRNPAERAVSAYWHMAKRLRELRCLEDVLAIDSVDLEASIDGESEGIRAAERECKVVTDGYERSIGDRYWSFRYLRNSCYLEDLRRFEAVFGRGQMLILLSDDLAMQPEESFVRTTDFLGIERFVPQSVGSLHNVTKVPAQNWISSILIALLRRLPASTDGVKRTVLAKISTNVPRVPKHIVESLVNLFRPHNESLSEYLDRDLSGWSELPLSNQAVSRHVNAN